MALREKSIEHPNKEDRPKNRGGDSWLNETWVGGISNKCGVSTLGVRAPPFLIIQERKPIRRLLFGVVGSFPLRQAGHAHEGEGGDGTYRTAIL